MGKNPQFVNPAIDNYHLRPDSPAIDAGLYVNVSQDIDGEPRPLNNGVDIGYDEVQVYRLALPVVIR